MKEAIVKILKSKIFWSLFLIKSLLFSLKDYLLMNKFEAVGALLADFAFYFIIYALVRLIVLKIRSEEKESGDSNGGESKAKVKQGRV